MPFKENPDLLDSANLNTVKSIERSALLGAFNGARERKDNVFSKSAVESSEKPLTAADRFGFRYPEFEQKGFSFSIKDKYGATPTVRLPNGQQIQYPTLKFRANPTTLDRPFKKVNNIEPSLSGLIEYHGGDDVDILTISGATATFYNSYYGLTNISEVRKATDAYQFIETLIALFLNNGFQYDSRGRVYAELFVYLSYDNNIYKGHFESLSVRDSVDKPYQLEYDFTFVAEETIYSFVDAWAQNHRSAYADPNSFSSNLPKAGVERLTPYRDLNNG